MKIKKSEKGFTLIEILVSIALFGMTCAILFTSILFALKNNKENHYAGEEIQMQMNSAENYSNKKTLFDNKVAAYRIDGSNQVEIKVKYNKTSDGKDMNRGAVIPTIKNDNVFAYQANAGYMDRSAAYNMRFFEPEEGNLYDPDSNRWWIRFHNISSVNVSREVYINPGNSIVIYGMDGESVGTHYSKMDLADSTGAVSFQFGLDLSNTPESDPALSLFFVGDWNNDFYNPESEYVKNNEEDIEITLTNIDKYKEYVKNVLNGDDDDPTNDVVTEELTGYIDFYYDGSSSGIMSKDEYQAKLDAAS